MAIEDSVNQWLDIHNELSSDPSFAVVRSLFENEDDAGRTFKQFSSVQLVALVAAASRFDHANRRYDAARRLSLGLEPEMPGYRVGITAQEAQENAEHQQRIGLKILRATGVHDPMLTMSVPPKARVELMEQSGMLEHALRPLGIFE